MQKSKLFLVFLFSMILSLVGCNSKVGTDLEGLYNTVSESDNEEVSEEDQESESEEVKVESISETNLNTNEIDVLLNDYESTVNQYNDYKERLNDGDITIITEVPALLKKVQDWKGKLEKVKGEMTPEQLLRMSQILNNI